VDFNDWRFSFDCQQIVASFINQNHFLSKEGIESETFEKCFSECRSLSSGAFESGARLSRIERLGFLRTGLVEIILPSSVEVLGEKCFAGCGSLS
jgi:hypothetical protein